MSYFQSDIPFMSDEELRENGIHIPKDVSNTNVGNIEYVSRQYLLDEYDRQHQGPPGGARKIIAEAPAEDVVPVVHAYWIPQEENHEFKEAWMKCSACGYPVSKWTGNTNFCPNCGAIMDAKEKG